MTRLALLRRPMIVDAIALAVIPVIASLFSTISLSPSTIDGWFYYAYGTDFRPLLARFGWTYYAARLSWNLIVKSTAVRSKSE
jgi:hypothetical protein